jgi:transposase
LEKKLPKTLDALLLKGHVKGRRIRLMFQDEARFGRMAKPKRCWAPRPCRPVMLNGYEREFVYVYGAVSPREGDFDWKLTPEMNADRMSEFLEQVSHRYPREFILIIVDGASSHRAKDLRIPENIRLVPLPSYSPELNPQEQIWDEIREKEFPNRVFDSMKAVKKQLCSGLRRLANDYERISSITNWPWIVTINLKAH